MIWREAVRHSSELSREVQAEVKTRRVPKIDFNSIIFIGYVKSCLHIDDLFATEMNKLNQLLGIIPIDFKCGNVLL